MAWDSTSLKTDSQTDSYWPLTSVSLTWETKTGIAVLNFSSSFLFLTLILPLCTINKGALAGGKMEWTDLAFQQLSIWNIEWKNERKYKNNICTLSNSQWCVWKACLKTLLGSKKWLDTKYTYQAADAIPEELHSWHYQDNTCPDSTPAPFKEMVSTSSQHIH